MVEVLVEDHEVGQHNIGSWKEILWVVCILVEVLELDSTWQREGGGQCNRHSFVFVLSVVLKEVAIKPHIELV